MQIKFTQISCNDVMEIVFIRATQIRQAFPIVGKASDEVSDFMSTFDSNCP